MQVVDQLVVAVLCLTAGPRFLFLMFLMHLLLLLHFLLRPLLMLLLPHSFHTVESPQQRYQCVWWWLYVSTHLLAMSLGDEGDRQADAQRPCL